MFLRMISTREVFVNVEHPWPLIACTSHSQLPPRFYQLPPFSSLHTAAPLPLGRACLYTGYPCTPLLMAKILGIFAWFPNFHRYIATTLPIPTPIPLPSSILEGLHPLVLPYSGVRKQERDRVSDVYQTHRCIEIFFIYLYGYLSVSTVKISAS